MQTARLNETIGKQKIKKDLLDLAQPHSLRDKGTQKAFANISNSFDLRVKSIEMRAFDA